MRGALVTMVVVALAAPGAAGATTVSGSLTGAKLPKKGKGVAAVRAIQVESGTVAGAKRTRTGSFSLNLPPARYLMLASTTPFRGTKASPDGPPVRVKVTKKAKKKLKIRVKKTKRKRRHRAHSAARPGFVDVDYPAIWVQHFDTTQMSAEWRVMGKGMADMLITDLASIGGPPGCPTSPVVVEREHLDEVIAEIERSNSPAFDPSTAIPRGHLTEHNMIVSGKLRTDGDKVFVDATVQDLRSGRTFTTTASGSAGAIFEVETELAGNLRQIICFPPAPGNDAPPPSTCGVTRQVCVQPPAGPPKSYAGAVSGTEEDPITKLKIEWNGNVTMTYTDRHNAGQGDAPPGDYWYFAPSGGSLHVNLSKPATDGDHCVWQGEVDVPIYTAGGDQSSVRADSGAPEYWLAGGFGPSDKVHFTGAGSDCQGEGDWNLYGMAYMFSGHAQKSASTTLIGSNTSGGGDAYTTQVTWQWSLGPQY